MAQNQGFSLDVSRGCNKILEDLNNDLKVLKGYRIPPQFFGPAAQQAQKSFQDDKFDSFDYECVSYRIDFPKDKPLSIGIFAKEAPI